jgi:hypothetical protein
VAGVASGQSNAVITATRAARCARFIRHHLQRSVRVAIRSVTFQWANTTFVNNL